MISNISEMFSKMIGTLAVILLVSAFIGGSDIISRFVKTEKKWKYSIVAGLLGGVFGIYGNISGFDFNGAVISVRDIGPMLAGFTGGPVGGLIAGLIAGIHRLTMGGITAWACVVATCCIGLACGVISKYEHKTFEKPLFALLISALMEAFHLCVVLIMVKPFETAFGIVSKIAIPFIAVNALGFMLMITIITYTESKRNLAIEKSRLQSELEVASVIQHSLLPSLTDKYPGRSEISVSASMQAAKQVGGDFYDVFFVDQDRIAFLIGDVSGKGVPAALFMASSKTILQNCIRDIPSLSAALFIANNVMCEKNEAEMFVTVWVGILDLKSGIMKYISAGHNHPVLIRGGKAEFIKSKSSFVLAGMENVKYNESELCLTEGDSLFLYTDGVTEAATSENELFGDERLLGCLNECAGEDVQAILDKVNGSIEAFVRDAEQFDDITMLCVKCN